MNFLESNIISQFVADHFYWVFLAIILLNITQRKHQAAAHKKRLATIYLAIAALVLLSAGQFVVVRGISDLYFLLAAGAVFAVAYRLRRHVFPFTLRCVQSGKPLDMHTILYRDSNTLPGFDPDMPSNKDEEEDDVTS